MGNLKRKLKAVFQFACNKNFLICFMIAWMITNGWAYLFIVFGIWFNISVLTAIGSAYIAFLWLPCTPEKILTVGIAVALDKKWFADKSSSLLVNDDEK